MSIQVTLTFATEAELVAYFARGKVQPSTVQHVAQHNAGVSADEKEAAANVGKSTSAATPAKPAPSQRTAEAAAETAVPAKTADASAPTAAAAETAQPASTAATDAPAATYADLQKAVLALHAKAPTEVLPIAQGLGLATFKDLKEAGAPEQIGAALAAVKAKIAELEVA